MTSVPARPSASRPEDRYLNTVEMAAGSSGRPKHRAAKPSLSQRAAAGPSRPRRPRPPGGSVNPLLACSAARRPRCSKPNGRPRPRRRPRPRQALDAKALRERLQQPLRPVKPQQPLDIGLFEVRPPEAPHILMPDE